MKNLLLILALSLVNNLFSQVTYVNYFDAVYPFYQSISYPPFDIDQNGTPDFKVESVWPNNSYMRFNVEAWTSNNRLNSLSQENAIDCTNDTLNALDMWNYYSEVYQSSPIMSVGTHKQGFRLALTNPANGALGYKYGYIDYTFTSGYDIVIHGWYYQNTFNAPIWANSQLTFPSSLNCLQIDTVTVYDTITTNVTIYDTITTNITTYDTLLVSVTDTLFINTSLGLPAPNNTNTIQVYPNPANDHITIDNGNFALMSNYTLKIENSLGQQVFSSLVNQQQFYIDLNGWSGNGVYFLKLINPQNNIVTIRKIVLQ